MVGAINWDTSIFEERFASPGEEVPVTLVEEFSGGKGANVAVAAARILGRGRVAFVGALGDDEVAGMQLTGLRDEGVATEGVIVIKGSRSGRAYILVDGRGRKTIHTHFGANETMSPGQATSGRAGRTLSNAGTTIVMDPPTPVALAVAREARKRGGRVIYSPGVRSREGEKALRGVLELAEYLVVDRHELRNMSGGAEEEVSLAKLRRDHPGLTVVGTLGERGCLIARDGVTTRIEGVSLAGLGMKAVNSTGSGDAFLGVFASYLMMGRGPIESAARGNLAGALKATRYETRGSPRRAELEGMMNRIERAGRANPERRRGPS